ncbi:hypothetical protein ACFLUR_01495 [Chloroflexota bacterium]
MKRILLSLMLGLVLSIVLGTSTAFAQDPPDSLIINAGTGSRPEMDTYPDSDGVPPPEITIIKRDGEIMIPGPPEKDTEPPPSGGL